MAVRIIGGYLGGRRLQVPDSLGLRPTSDRVRETLFNWLQGFLAGARCLDLFSGSGCLGLEALSRGAGSVVAIEKNRKVFQLLQSRAREWNLNGYRVLNNDAFDWLNYREGEIFDCIFVDPPFQLKCLGRVTERIFEKGCLAANGVIYIERPIDQALPLNVTTFKEKQVGSVVFGLYHQTLPGENKRFSDQ